MPKQQTENLFIRTQNSPINHQKVAYPNDTIEQIKESHSTLFRSYSLSSLSLASSSTSCPSLIERKHVIQQPEAMTKAKSKKPTNKSSSSASTASSTSTSTSTSVSASASHSGHIDSTASKANFKRYKNSPFGLTNHYLALPDDSVLKSDRLFRHSLAKGQSVAENDELATSTSDGLSLESKSVKLAKDWIENRAVHKEHIEASVVTDPDNQCDLSVLGPSSVSGSLVQEPAAWHHGHYQKPVVQLASANELIQLHRHDLFDKAGLDAKQCNAANNRDPECLAYYQSGPMPHKSPILGPRIYRAPSQHLKDLDAQSKHPLSMNQNHNDSGQCATSLLVKFSSIMYATFLVILGCILHISELRHKSKNSSDHIYTIIVALIGIIWLIFLQSDLQRYKRYASKYILIETIFNDHQHQKSLESANWLQHQSTGELASSRSNIDPSARSTSSSSASLVNDRMSLNTEVIFKKTAYKMYQQRATNRYHKQQANLDRDRKKDKANSVSSIYDHYTRSLNEPNSISDHLDQLVPAYKFLHGKMGANFYLKCGMAAFCFGHVIHEGLRFGQQLYFSSTGNVHCRDSAALFAHLITPLYSFYQLFMMFKYSNLVINRHKVLARFGLMHIVGTSITFWFRTILEEAFEDFVHKMDYFKTNKPQIYPFSHYNTNENRSATTENLTSLLAKVLQTNSNENMATGSLAQSTNTNVTIAHSILSSLMSSPISATITPQIARNLPDSYACAQNTLLTTKSMNALPYLYPFTIEYNLLLAATFLSLYFNIGKIGSHGNNCIKAPDLGLTSPHLYAKSKANKTRSSTNSSTSFTSNLNCSSDNSTRTGLRNSDGSQSYNHGKEPSEYKSNFVVNADCHAANKGLFCGFFVLLVTLVTIVIFFVTINKPTHVQLGIKINLIQESTLTALLIVITLAGFKQVIKLNRNPHLRDKVTTDDVLMLIPLPFFFIHSLLSFRAEIATLYSANKSSTSSILLQKNHQRDQTINESNNLQSILLKAASNNSNISNSNNTKLDQPKLRLNHLLAGIANGTQVQFDENFISNTLSNNNSGSNSRNSDNRNNINVINIDANNSNFSQIDHFKLITVALNIFVMIEVLVQTNFIIDGMRRCSESRYLRFKKPGRELITFAILLNITYWIVATFETKSVEQYKTEIEYYGPLPYMFISHTTLPVMLFYRYHSSVCLAEMWNRAYKPPKKR